MTIEQTSIYYSVYNINDNARKYMAIRSRLIFAHIIIFLFFMAFKETISEIDKTSSNVTPTVIESGILKIKSDRLRRQNYNMFRDIDEDREEEDIRPHIKREKNSREPKIWDQWGNWSTCSVTCGIGKIVRWRHCIGGRCSLGEKKAQLKTCTSAAC